jgi:hypothetical protein
VEVQLEDIELNGETLRRAQTALVEQSKPYTISGTGKSLVDGATSGSAEVEPESEEEPLFTYAGRKTGAAISTGSPVGQNSGVASPQVPSDDSKDNNASLNIGGNHESKSEERGRGRGS